MARHYVVRRPGERKREHVEADSLAEAAALVLCVERSACEVIGPSRGGPWFGVAHVVDSYIEALVWVKEAV